MIPLFKPSVSPAEIEAVTRVLCSGWWGMGPETEAFESEFANYTGTVYAVAVNSATSALELAARAAGVVNGVVIAPALTFISTAQAMQHAGNTVIFADIDEDTLCLDWDDVARKLKPVNLRPQMYGPAAVVPVWYGGTVAWPPYDLGMPMIEDCAHATGSLNAGLRGIASCWSFHAVKNLATGDGGMVTTNDPEMARRLKALRWCGIDKSTWERDQGKYGWDYSIPADGEKMHMNDITAALGRVQLRRLDQMNAARYHIAMKYNAEFMNLEWLRIPYPLDSSSSNHLYVVRVDDRNRFIDHMLENGVSAGVHYKPLTHYPHLFGGRPWDLPVTERVWQTLVTLPLFPDMTEGEQEQVIEAVRSFKA